MLLPIEIVEEIILYLDLPLVKLIYLSTRLAKEKYKSLKHLNPKTNYVNAAARRGQLDMIKWFHNNDNECFNEYSMNYAAGNGHFNVVKWLHENRTERCFGIALTLAAENGHFEVVKFLYENRKEVRHDCAIKRAMTAAFDNKHHVVATWLQKINVLD